MEMIDLRYSLAMERIRGIHGEDAVAPLYRQYFETGAFWLLLIDDEMRFLASQQAQSAPVSVLRERNMKLYEEILPENYKNSFANPDYAVKMFGEENGPVLAALRYELRSAVPFAYRLMKERVLVRAELFLEVYTAFMTAYRESGEGPDTDWLKNIIRQYLADYAEDEMRCYLADKLTVTDDRVKRLALGTGSGGGTGTHPGEADAGPDRPAERDCLIRDLYLTGEYVTDNETESAALIASLPEEKTALIADTITEGFRRGFVNGGKNLALKKNAAVLFHLGFERIFRKCADNLERMGLTVILPSEIPTLFHSYRHGEMGYSGADPNPQYAYDHREDLALFLNENLRARRLEGLENAYRSLRDKTVLYAGPLMILTFGERPFSPVPSAHAPHFGEAQQKMCAAYTARNGELYSDAVVSKNRSFTAIAFPLPQIAETNSLYREIFDAVLDINTLDSKLYESIQAGMIDVLNTAVRVEVRGKAGNRTDLTVRLHVPADPSAEANFENCTADVNIPVGEVYTTPVLEGTEGVLHVTGVYLDGLYFRDLELIFREGRVCDYRCANFDDEEENRRYIEENVLFHHEGLPMGECAIGTNTTAYRAAAKYRIADRLPILIAEKTGPHFAVGDTCYTRIEDNRVFNPDGREVVAKENTVSALRKTDPEKAYFGCHTDITIPYGELAEFTAVRENGERIPIIRDGRFILEGTQILNIPLENMTL